MVTQERLKELFYYHPESGDFIRLIARPKSPVGTQAGSMNSEGYMVIRIDGKSYRAHRLAFLYMEGAFPPADGDHKNLIRHENWWANLRPATRSQNKFNCGPHADNVASLKLISWDKKHKGYQVQTMVNGKSRWFGYFKKLPDAIDAAAQIMLTFHSDFARVA